MEMAMQQMDQTYGFFHVLSMSAKIGSNEIATTAKDSDLLTKERLCRALSMFEVVMRRIKEILMKDEMAWQGPPPANGVMSIEECQEFHRVWSAIQFAYCMPLSAGQINVE